MGYNRIGTPRAFVDLISYNLAHGWSALANITAFKGVDGGNGTVPITYDSGSTIEMFDMKPSNHVVIDADNKQFYIQYDSEFSSDTLAESSFLAILNHNLDDACVVINVDISDNAAFPAIVGSTAVDFTASSDRIGGSGLFGSFAVGDLILVSNAGESGNNGVKTVTSIHANYVGVSENLTDESASRAITVQGFTRISTTGNHTKVINAAEGASAGEINPATNGWTLITWPTQTSDNKYLRITFTDDVGYGHDFDTDVKIGSILYGEIVDWAHSPDLGITTTVDYDGTTLQQSVGGSTYANSTYFGQSNWSTTAPWNLNADASSHYSFNRRYGRINHSMKFSYLADTDVFALNQHSATTSSWFDSDNLHASFYQRILGQHLPFLFTIDGTSTSEGDYGLFRLANSGFSSTQVAHQVWDVALDITESW